MGCDCSSKLIDCVLIGDNDLFKTYSFESKNKDWDIRSKELFSSFQNLVEGMKYDKIVPDIVYIE